MKFIQKKSSRLNHKNKFPTIYFLKRVKNFVSSLITFFNFFFLIHHFSRKIWIFTSSILSIFVNLFDFFTFPCYKKTNEVSICKIISAIFWLGIILERLLQNYIKLYSYLPGVSSTKKVGGSHTDPPRIKYFKKSRHRAIKLK